MRLFSIVLLFLAACTGSDEAENSASDATDGSDDASGSGTYPLTSGEDTWTAFTWGMPYVSLHMAWVVDLENQVENALDTIKTAEAALPDCLTLIDTDERREIDGGEGCTIVEGFEWSGSLAVDSPDDSTLIITYDALVMDITEDGAAAIGQDGTLHFAAHGTVETVAVDTSSGVLSEHTSIDRVASEDFIFDDSFGTVAWQRSLEFQWNETGESGSGSTELIVPPAGAEVGSFTVDYSLSHVDACDQEGDGFLVVDGASLVRLEYDGSTACDACADVTINGQPADPFCR